MASRKKRVRNWTSEDRAAHRVFEKSRREAFNDSMIDLARQLPSLATTRRLNKHMIVDHSIARLQSQRNMCLAAATELRGLVAERDQLLAEVNHWRASSGAAFTAVEPSPLGLNLGTLLDTEAETFGTFPNGFGDNTPEGCIGDGDDGSDEAGATVRPTGQPRHQQANWTTTLGHQTVALPQDASALEGFGAPSAFSDMYGLEGFLEDRSKTNMQPGQTSSSDMLAIQSGPGFTTQHTESTAQTDPIQILFDFQDQLAARLPDNPYLNAGQPFDDQLLLSNQYFTNPHHSVF